MNKIENQFEELLINKFNFSKSDIKAFKKNIENVNDWDSIKHLELIMAIEEKYNIKFPYDKNFDLKKFSDFIKLIKNLQK